MEIMSPITVNVAGTPKPQPRPRAFACRKTGRARVYDAGTAENWKSCVAKSFEDYAGLNLSGPLLVEIMFIMPRPKSHWSKKDGWGLVPSAPVDHIKKPDLDNLAKAVLDCLTEIKVWTDDSIITGLILSKRYELCTSGAEITIRRAK